MGARLGDRCHLLDRQRAHRERASSTWNASHVAIFDLQVNSQIGIGLDCTRSDGLGHRWGRNSWYTAGLPDAIEHHRTRLNGLWADARSASLPSRDILFPALGSGRNPGECGPLRPFIRTTGTRPEADFGPFSVSLHPPSPTQPNHAKFSTDVRSSEDQWVTEIWRGAGSKGARSGGVNRERTVRFGTDLRVRPPSMGPGPSGRPAKREKER
jgi:hypothetical protein